MTRKLTTTAATVSRTAIRTKWNAAPGNHSAKL